ncbi:hypothetical protein [Streptomyces sp. NPDC054838]
MEAPQKTLAEKLATLIGLKRRPDGTMYPKSEIAEAVSRLYAEDRICAARAAAEEAGASEAEIEAAVAEVRAEKPLLNRAYLSLLVNGHRDNPTVTVVEYLAQWFGVSPAYFFGGTPETSATEREVELVTEFRRLVKAMQEGGQTDAPQLLTSLTRGLSALSPETVRGMIHMQLAAIDLASREQQ